MCLAALQLTSTLCVTRDVPPCIYCTALTITACLNVSHSPRNLNSREECHLCNVPQSNPTVIYVILDFNIFPGYQNYLIAPHTMGDVLGGDAQRQLSRQTLFTEAAVCFYVLLGKCVTIRGTLRSIVKV